MAELQRIRLEDKGLFRDFFQNVKEPLADTTFAMRYIWSVPLRHTWTMINGNLCVFGFLKDKYLVWGPPVGGGNLPGTISSCFEIVEKLNSSHGINAKPCAIYIPECLKPDYEAVAEKMGWAFQYWTQDYIYRTKDLIELKGSEFESKRHKVNFFMKNYSCEVEEFDAGKHAEGCIRLVELWGEQKNEADDGSWRYELESETEVAKTLLKSASALDAKGIVLKIDGNIVGVSLGEQLAPNMCSNIIEKTSPAVNGAAQFIFREFARLWSGCEFLNAQDDFGVDYLKRVKLSYHPARLLASYCLEKK